MAAIIDQIYQKINEVFKSSNQTFLMEFPGRVLNKDLYAYDTRSIYAEETKPQPVVEEEFRLTDDLFDVGNISGGPSGKKLSSVYEEALNMLVPRFDITGDFYQDKQKIRAWLLEQVDYEIPKKTTGAKAAEETAGAIIKIARIDLYKKLNKEYEDAKLEWKQNKVNALIKAEGNDKSLEDFTRKVAIEAESIDGELDGVFADLVVRGFYHEVKNCLAYLDIKSVAEELEDAKSKMRMSSMTSFDESEIIYPVQLQPNDWFSGLSSDFTAEDLLTDPDYLTDKLLSKQNALDALEAKIASLKTAHTGDATGLQKEIDTAQANLDNAQSEMIKNFSSATMTLIQMYLKDASGKGELDAFNNTARAKKSGVTLDKEDWDKVEKFQTATIENQQKLMTSSRALSALMAAKASAESTDTQVSIQALQLQADQLRNGIEGLKKICMAKPRFGITQSTLDNVLKTYIDKDDTFKVAPLSQNLKDALQEIVGKTYDTIDVLLSKIQTATDKITDAAKKKDFISKITSSATPSSSLLPSMPPPSRWMDLVITADKEVVKNNSSLKTGSSQSSWSVGLIFGSVGGSNANSFSDFNAKNFDTSTNIEIGMRATKVTIDRGWFRPEFFNLTKSMFRLDPELIASGVRMEDDDAKLEDINKSFFPTYPISFVVVKDVTIKFKASTEHTSTIKNVLDQSASVGGGFLCFSASHASTSHNASENFLHNVDGQSVTIKIPGPQILGWYLEYLPKDESLKDYTKMPDGALPHELIPNPTPALSKAKLESVHVN
jgi:hypothetical protein